MTAARKVRLTEQSLRALKPEETPYQVWDLKQRGLTVRVQPSGRRGWYFVFSRQGRPRWLHLGDAEALGVEEARKRAAVARVAVDDGRDPAAEKKAKVSAGTFADLHSRYLEQYAKKRNKSWKQADALVRRYLLPQWKDLQAPNITYADVEALLSKIEAPVLANQVLVSASAVFSWAEKRRILTANPCKGIERNKTTSRDRVLSDTEVPLFWQAFDDAGLIESTALKLILLTGQRPGEVAHMRREHVSDGWWTMPGAPDPKLGWPGTKNGESHRVWLSEPVRALLDEVDGDFRGPRQRPVLGFDGSMRVICKKLGVSEKVTPHDLRRTFSTKVTGLGFGRDALNRVTNHKEGGIASVYDRHGYADENKKVMETVAAHIMALVEGPADNVVQMRR